MLRQLNADSEANGVATLKIMTETKLRIEGILLHPSKPPGCAGLGSWRRNCEARALVQGECAVRSTCGWEGMERAGEGSDFTVGQPCLSLYLTE